ncbi:hypothetical protein HDU97_001354 [Phlyctochytrium planicorne]|nr:hypothetical protein HDU97_001354 [Phlyctochytrium planicorne]
MLSQLPLELHHQILVHIHPNQLLQLRCLPLFRSFRSPGLSFAITNLLHLENDIFDGFEQLQWWDLGRDYLTALLLIRGLTEEAVKLLGMGVYTPEMGGWRNHDGGHGRLGLDFCHLTVDGECCRPSVDPRYGFGERNLVIDGGGGKEGKLDVMVSAISVAINTDGFDVSLDDFFAVQWVASIGHVDLLRKLVEMVKAKGEGIPSDPSRHPGLTTVLEKALHLSAYRGSVKGVLEVLKMMMIDRQEQRDRNDDEEDDEFKSITDAVELFTLSVSAATLGQHVRIADAILKVFPGCNRCRHMACRKRFRGPIQGFRDEGHGERDCMWEECFSTMQRIRGVLPPLCTLLTDARVPNLIEFAASRGRASIVKLLMDYGFDPTMDEDAALRISAGRGHVKALKVLLEDLKDLQIEEDGIEIGGIDGIEDIEHSSALEGFPARRRIDPGARDGEAVTAAAAAGFTEVVQLLISTGRSRPSSRNSQALRRSAERGHSDIVEILLRYPGDRVASRCAEGSETSDEDDGRGPVDPSAGDNHCIKFAARNGHERIVAMLLEFCERGDAIDWLLGREATRTRQTVDPSADRDFALRKSSEQGHYRIVQMLLDTGKCAANALTDLPLRLASKNGHEMTVRCLLSHWQQQKEKSRTSVVSDLIDPAAVNNESIRQAASKGHTGVVKAFLELAGDACDPAACGSFALKMSARFGHIEVVRLLLEDGRCDASVEHNFAMKKALANGHMEVVRILFGR